MKGLQWLHENFANRVIKFARKGFSNMSSEFHNGRRCRRRRRHRLIKIASYVYYTIAGPKQTKQTRLGLAGLPGQHRVARVQ